MALAAVKFFLGQDEAPGAGSDDEEDDLEERVAGPTKAELYAAHKKVRHILLIVLIAKGCFQSEFARSTAG